MRDIDGLTQGASRGGGEKQMLVVLEGRTNLDLLIDWIRGAEERSTE